MPLLVVGVMFQVVLTGGIFPLTGKVGLEQVSWLSPSRWGFAAVASTVEPERDPAAGGAEGAGAAPSDSPARASTRARSTTTAGGTSRPRPPRQRRRAASRATASTALGWHHPEPTPTTTPTATPSATPSGRARRRRPVSPPRPRPRYCGSLAQAEEEWRERDAVRIAAARPPAGQHPPRPRTAGFTDPLWKHNANTWLTDMAAMLVLGLVFTLLAWWRLVKLSPGRRK